MKVIVQQGKSKTTFDEYKINAFEVEEEKEKPMKIQEVLLPYGKGYECRNCGNELSATSFNGKYCHWCGQKLDWGEGNE